MIILPDLNTLPFYRQIITPCQELGFESKIAPNIAPNIKGVGIFTITIDPVLALQLELAG